MRWRACCSRQPTAATASQPLGLLARRDQAREDAAAGLAVLHRLGLRPVMLTGDTRRAAEVIGRPLGIKTRAGLLPGD